MTHTLKTALLALALAAAIGITSAHAATGGRAVFRRTDAGNVSRVVFRPGCIDAEDSAAHLRLVRYGNGRAVYGCSRKGY